MTREEALQVLKERMDYYENEKRMRAAIEVLVPEFAEKEDDKIIQFFAELATDACGGPGQEYYEEFGLNYDKVMTWLKKQKEQDKCPEYCVRSHCIGCSIYEKRKEDKPSIFPPGLGEARWNPISSVQQKPMHALTKGQYVEKFRSLCDLYEIKLPNRAYDIYHLCGDLAKLFGNTNKQE